MGRTAEELLACLPPDRQELIATRSIELKKELRCPWCGASPFHEEQEHGHYYCTSCKTVTAGCCDGNQ